MSDKNHHYVKYPFGSMGLQTVLFALALLVVNSVQGYTVSIRDTVTENGRFYAECAELDQIQGKVTYVWHKSINGGAFQPVERRRVTGPYYNVAYDGTWVDIVLDGGVLSGQKSITQVEYKCNLVTNGVLTDVWSPVELQRAPEDGRGAGTDLPQWKGYFDSLQNGSFENPRIGSGMIHWSTGYDITMANNDGKSPCMEGFWVNRDDLTHDEIMTNLWQAFPDYDVNKIFYRRRPSIMWKTTAPDGALEIAACDDNFAENGSSTHRDNCKMAYNIAETADGYQFAELNCNYPSQLYQDIITVPGSTIKWSICHRARKNWETPVGATDTMRVLIGDTHRIVKENITDIKSVQYVAEHPELYPGFTNVVCTSDNYGWHEYSGQYVVPEGQYYTRMGFVSIQTATGEIGGNILDNITFELQTPPPDGDLDDAVESLWITDHEDAGSDHVYLEIQPTLKGGTLFKDWMNDFVLRPGIVGVIRAAYGRTEAELEQKIKANDTLSVSLRNGNGNHNNSWDRDRLWVKIPSNPDGGNFSKFFWKVIIDHPRDVE